MANHELQIFDFNCNNIRVIEIDGEPWFVISDVCKVLTVGNTTDATRNLDQIKVTSYKFPGSYGRPNKLVSESGLYKVAMRSDKPEAIRFQNWIAQHVIPSIRKNGSYVLGEENIGKGPLEEDLRALQRGLKASERISKMIESERDQYKDQLEWISIQSWCGLNRFYPTGSERQNLCDRRPYRRPHGAC